MVGSGVAILAMRRLIDDARLKNPLFASITLSRALCRLCEVSFSM